MGDTLQIVGISAAAALAVGGGMISLALKEPAVQKVLSRWLLVTSLILFTPVLIALHFHAQGMESAAALLKGAEQVAVIQDVASTRFAKAICLLVLAYLVALLSFCSWLRDVKRDTEKK
ncbi:hypothetical protein [Sphingosinicella microcystinivorans]|uniref:Uncharacterized protein n=3 Tax=Sphingosinicella microcystinivorans TaxID=335406 RepID=A0AAD1D8U2_SPHMI|nr:hypothetical protein [Sphingosinicella microcystinivorans]BBE35409.1 hypothetical protein SmB9_30670 [Sphingosinicella microcystinivorans]